MAARKRLWALLLSGAMVLVQIPAVAKGDVAKNGLNDVTGEKNSMGGGYKTIESFEPLDKSVLRQSAYIGTEFSELNLPSTVRAVVCHGTEEVENPDEDSTGEDDNDGSATPSDADKKASGKDSKKKTEDGKKKIQAVTSLEDISVTWDSDPAYNPNAIGSYTFQARAQGYTLAEGAEWPEITVTVYRMAFRTINDRYVIDGLIYKEIGPEEVQLIGYQSLSGSLDVPSGIQADGRDFRVTSIGAQAFYGCATLTGTVTIPDSVTYIGDYAFSGSGMEGLDLGEGVRSIGNYAFYQCTDLIGTVDIPSTVKTIGDCAFRGSGMEGLTLTEGLQSVGEQAFYQCAGLAGAVDIPSTVKTIGNYAFRGSGIEGLTLAEGLQSIGNDAFRLCAKLKGTVEIPSTVRSVGENAFSYSKIEGLILNNGLVSIGKSAFYQCADLKGAVIIPESVTFIGDGAFGWSGIESLTLMEGLVTIEASAFASCRSLTGTVTIPSTVTSIGSDAFTRTGITSFTAGSDAVAGMLQKSGIDPSKINAPGAIPQPAATIRKGPFTYTITGTDTVTLKEAIGVSGNAVIPDTVIDSVTSKEYRVTSIGESAFSGWGPTGVTLPQYLESIGNSAFAGCMGLSGTIQIPPSVKYIDDLAFNGTKITGLYLSQGLESIGRGAFFKCENLKGTIAVPGSVHFIGEQAFQGSGIEGLTLAEGLQSIGNQAFYKCAGLGGTIEIPSTVEDIGEQAFRESGIEGLELHEGLQSIGEYAFYQCVSLTGTVTIPSTVKSIGLGAFYGSGISEIKLTEGLESLGDYMFYKCTNLTGKINIPSTVKSIGASAFRGSGITGADIRGKLDNLGWQAFPDDIPVHCEDPDTQLLLVEQSNQNQIPSASWDGKSDIPAGAVVTIDKDITIGRDVSVGAGAKITVAEGSTVTIGAGAALTIESGATLDGGGKIVVQAGGALSGNAADSLEVVYPVGGVSLSDTAISLNVGESKLLTATVKPDNATDKSVIWSSSAPGVAAVDKSGSVSAVSVGNATIKVTTADGGYTAECAVTVVKKTETGSGGTGGGGSNRSGAPRESYTVTGNAVSQSVSLSDLRRLADSGKSLTVGNSAARVTFEPAALRAILAAVPAAAGSVSISAVPADISAFPEAAALIGNRPAFDFSIIYKDSEGNTAAAKADFPAGAVSIALSYTPAAGEAVGSLFAVCVNGDGTVTWFNNSGYDNGRLLADAPHFSVYGVAYKAGVPAFTDIADHWAKEDIEFAAARALFSEKGDSTAGASLGGTDSSLFSPDASLTRGRFVTALGRLSGIELGSDKISDPDGVLTREQMAVLMADFAGQMGYSIPSTLKEAAFFDSGEISASAVNHVAAMQRAGIIKGKSGGCFEPQAAATRAEAAAALHRFAEAVIDPSTACGWAKNDSGQWNYFYSGGEMALNAKVDGYDIGPDGVRVEK